MAQSIHEVVKLFYLLSPFEFWKLVVQEDALGKILSQNKANVQEFLKQVLEDNVLKEKLAQNIADMSEGKHVEVMLNSIPESPAFCVTFWNELCKVLRSFSANQFDLVTEDGELML